MKGLIVTAIIAAVLLFPIFIQSYVFWDSETKKAGFAVYFAGIVRILSGYAQLYTGGIVFHLSEKKAVILLSGGLDSATIAIRRRSRLSSVLLASFRSISEYFS